MVEDTLSRRISKRLDLTEAEQASLVALFGSGCRQQTKAALARAARIVPDIRNYGIYDRVNFNKNGAASYCAGQSYPDEIRLVRDLLVGRAH